MLLSVILIVAAYLIGAVPFGYLIAKSKGVDLFKVGSGNIGATNVGRVLGRKYGILVFILDFLKGAGPVAIVPLAVRAWPANDAQPSDWLRVGVGLAAFLGHVLPIYLGFRGGKGVATGAGTVFVLLPGPSAVAALIWIATVASGRTISLASIAAAVTLGVARAFSAPTTSDAFVLTGFCITAATIVILKHRGNLLRLLQGTENRLEETPMLEFWQRALHILAIAIWLGSAFFFNLLAAPTIFATFKEVAHSGPSDRTAYFTINSGLDDKQMDQLGNALAGAAVGPVFPLFFALHGICGIIALITALGWWRRPGSAHRWRCILIGVAWLAVIVGWPISQHVTELRISRFSTDPSIAAAAKGDFATWHLASLGLSLLTVVLVFAATILAAKLPMLSETPASKSE